MNARKLFGVVFVVLLATLAIVSVTNAQGPALRAPRGGGDGLPITYQGQLKQSGTAYTGTCDMQFGLWDDATVGTQKGMTQTVTANVTNGLFTVELNSAVEFGTSGFDGNLRWLAITTRCPSGSGTYTKLSSRQKLTYAPMALALPGLFTQQHATSPNIIGGVTGNAVSVGVYGATISGGGYTAMANYVSDNYGVIGGGANNNAGNLNADVTDANYATVGGGLSNSAAGLYTTVGGGESNTTNSMGATIGGGRSNDALNAYATVSGGWNNTASGFYSTISGGNDNVASSAQATIPGGSNNVAASAYTFAAGYQAVANHQGAFVWADSSGTPITSTTTNQFVIRATNGVSLTKDAGSAKAIAIGERYRDNAIIAWGDVSSTGIANGAFGISSITKSTGMYTITLTALPSNAFTIVPVVTPETDSAPTSAANARLVAINILAPNQFVVYITNGSYTLTDNQFVFMVTGR